MIKRVGFFDCNLDCDNRFACAFELLEEALDFKSASGKLCDSLIVLPEAFNLGKPYYAVPGTTNAPGDAKIPSSQALIKLRDESAKRGVVFVAGLVGELFSSAYWIDNTGDPELMCHKMSEDHSQSYKQWTSADHVTIIERLGVCAAALICNDAMDLYDPMDPTLPPIMQRRAQLLETVGYSSQPHKVICIRTGRPGLRC